VQIHQAVQVSGYVTKDKFIRGRAIVDIERTLGFHNGRFRGGIVVIRLDRLPTLSQFELAGYSMTAEHRFAAPSDLNIDKLKQLALESWSLIGVERLVKVRPNTEHDLNLAPDWQYPPGLGVPQWKLTTRLPGTVIDVIDSYPDGRYQPRM
jgi:hypothetical protein